jgi:hypothetical protein
MAQRWQCQSCGREWVFSTNNDRCVSPSCDAPFPELVVFTPQFRGGDIRTHPLPTHDPNVLHGGEVVTGPGQAQIQVPPAVMFAPELD